MGKNGNGSKPSAQVLHGLKIELLDDKTISVSGFPNNLFEATNLLTAALNAVMVHFLEHAQAGNLDQKLTVIVPKNDKT